MLNIQTQIADKIESWLYYYKKILFAERATQGVHWNRSPRILNLSEFRRSIWALSLSNLEITKEIKRKQGMVEWIAAWIEPWEIIALIPSSDHYCDFLHDLGEKKKEKKERKKERIVHERVRNFEREKTRLCVSRLAASWTFVSRPEVHCYENQWSVGIRMKTRNVRKRSRAVLFAALFRFIPMESGRAHRSDK